MITSTDITLQVSETLTDRVGEFDVAGIVRDIIAEHGRVDVDSIESETYWDLVARHATSILEVSVEGDTAETGWIIPPAGRSIEDADLDADGHPLETVTVPASDDPDEWNRAADAALTHAGWQRVGEFEQTDAVVTARLVRR